MTKLSFIAIEARRHLGGKPVSGLARAMWAVTPHFADLIVDLYGGSSDRKFSEAVCSLPPTTVLAALVLAEIERGDAEGTRLAYEAMMLFETPQAREIHTDSVRCRLHGDRPELGRWHKHAHHDPFFRSLAIISEQTGRYDFQALAVAIEYLTAIQANPVAREGDQEAKRILGFLRDIDLVFQGFEEGRIHYTLRGEPKKPISGKRLEEMLAQIRGNL